MRNRLIMLDTATAEFSPPGFQSEGELLEPDLRLQSPLLLRALS